MIEREPAAPPPQDPASIRDSVASIASARSSIVCLHLFGSHASGHAGKHSDFDCAYHSRPALTLMEEADLLYDISRALGTSEVDLVSLRSMPVRNRLAVLEEGILLYRRSPEEVADLLAATRLEYFDYVPLEREYDAAFLQNLKDRLG